MSRATAIHRYRDCFNYTAKSSIRQQLTWSHEGVGHVSGLTEQAGELAVRAPGEMRATHFRQAAINSDCLSQAG